MPNQDASHEATNKSIRPRQRFAYSQVTQSLSMLEASTPVIPVDYTDRSFGFTRLTELLEEETARVFASRPQDLETLQNQLADAWTNAYVRYNKGNQ